LRSSRHRPPSARWRGDGSPHLRMPASALPCPGQRRSPFQSASLQGVPVRSSASSEAAGGGRSIRALSVALRRSSRPASRSVRCSNRSRTGQRLFPLSFSVTSGCPSACIVRPPRRRYPFSVPSVRRASAPLARSFSCPPARRSCSLMTSDVTPGCTSLQGVSTFRRTCGGTPSDTCGVEPMPCGSRTSVPKGTRTSRTPGPLTACTRGAHGKRVVRVPSDICGAKYCDYSAAMVAWRPFAARKMAPSHGSSLMKSRSRTKRNEGHLPCFSSSGA
jgi:hypothetical protein